jgi:hypothetical protein
VYKRSATGHPLGIRRPRCNFNDKRSVTRSTFPPSLLLAEETTRTRAGIRVISSLVDEPLARAQERGETVVASSIDIVHGRKRSDRYDRSIDPSLSTDSVSSRTASRTASSSPAAAAAAAAAASCASSTDRCNLAQGDGEERGNEGACRRCGACVRDEVTGRFEGKVFR